MGVKVFERRPEVAVPCACVLGEGPIWDHRIATLHWVDIEAGTLWSWRPGADEEPMARPVGERVGFALLTQDCDVVLLGLKSGLARYSLSEGATVRLVAPEPDLPGNRPNDGVVAPDGSVFFGTLNEADRQPTGHFYRWAGGEAFRFGTGTKTTNGPAIDEERRILYATDTSRGRVFRYPLSDDGSLGDPADFVAFGEGDGHPDGMAVDAESHVWICHFGAGRITRFDPDGNPVLVVPMPTPQVTKLAFGGPDLRTVYVTSAARDLDREIDPMAGHLFRFEPGIRGRPSAAHRVEAGQKG